MTNLDNVISNAFTQQGEQSAVNKVYLTLLKTQLFLPVKPETQHIPEEPFSPLFAKVDEKYFLMAFDDIERLTAWAGEYSNQMGYVELSGKYLIQGMAEEKVYLGLNVGTKYYKEFSPDEIKRLKIVAARIDQLRESNAEGMSAVLPESTVIQRFK